ncbi:MAG: CoA pyrophosphatase [Rhodospirillales bacterium]
MIRQQIIDRLRLSDPARQDAGYTFVQARRPAAVLVPIVDRAGGATVLLTQRTDHLNDHAGQISFPGGRIDPGDRDAEAAALRETEEEVGITADRIDLLGRLAEYNTGTGFTVTPVVALVRPPFDVRIDPFEVADVFEAPLSLLLDLDRYSFHMRVRGGRLRRFYQIEHEGRIIWGATAGMLRNLAHVMTET